MIHTSENEVLSLPMREVVCKQNHKILIIYKKNKLIRKQTLYPKKSDGCALAGLSPDLTVSRKPEKNQKYTFDMLFA